MENFQGGGNALGNSGLVELSSILAGRNRLHEVSIFGSGFREVQEED